MRINFLWLVFGLFIFSSCEFEEVNVVSIGKVALDSFEGNNAFVNVDVELENPNFFGIKIKPCALDVYIEDEYVGKAHLMEKVKIIKKTTQIYNAKIQLVGEDGILKKIIKYALRKDLKVRLTGAVKGSVYGIPKKVMIDETKTIDGRILKMKNPFFN